MKKNRAISMIAILMIVGIGVFFSLTATAPAGPPAGVPPGQENGKGPPDDVPPGPPGGELTLEELGRKIFFEETFEGNGRTCGTCHPAENNLTIDAKFIATLADDDPLFVAEFVPGLADLEKPELMRKFGLILENLNGFDQQGFMRCVPHMLSLRTSIGPTPGPGIGGAGDVAGAGFTDATGWSGDGSPLAFPGTGVTITTDGSLRAFIQGAIVQHYPKTLDRIPISEDNPDGDFRLATKAELDAVEAFLLSLGRQEDIDDLAGMRFKDEIVNAGNMLFNSAQLGKCFLCHRNAGAFNVPLMSNANLNTGVEDQVAFPALLIDETFRRDDGLGGRGEDDPPGDGTFNIPPLVEAADTAPFFHNNSATTVESAVGFFNSSAFNNSPAGLFLQGATNGEPINLDASEVVAIASLLRTLNALENIRLSNLQDERAMEAKLREGKRLLAVSKADTEDALEVLSGGNVLLFPEAVALLSRAFDLVKRAQNVGIGKRNRLLEKSIALREAARSEILE